MSPGTPGTPGSGGMNFRRPFNDASPGSPHPQFGGASGSPMMYGGAPRRQPRRYKTSKLGDSRVPL